MHSNHLFDDCFIRECLISMYNFSIAEFYLAIWQLLNKISVSFDISWLKVHTHMVYTYTFTFWYNQIQYWSSQEA